jgi:hypothetical protein
MILGSGAIEIVGLFASTGLIRLTVTNGAFVATFAADTFVASTARKRAATVSSFGMSRLADGQERKNPQVE